MWNANPVDAGVPSSGRSVRAKTNRKPLPLVSSPSSQTHSSTPDVTSLSNSTPPLVTYEDLLKENSDLRKELKETKLLTKQLFCESLEENYDKRRVNLLKAQLFQMERQALLLNRAMAARTAVLWEAENTLQALKARCQAVANDVTPSPTVTLARQHFYSLIEGLEKARGTLSRHLENQCTNEKLQQKNIIPNRFAREDLHILDLLSGSEPMLHLKEVTALESKVHQCYVEVEKLSMLLDGWNSEEKKTEMSNSIFFAGTEVEKLRKQADETKNHLKATGWDLLKLSILVPFSDHTRSPLARKNQQQEQQQKHCYNPQHLTPKLLLSRFPKTSIAKSKLIEVTNILKSYMHICNMNSKVQQIQLELRKSEVEQYLNLFNIQSDFVNNLINGLKQSYEDFYSSISQAYLDPIENVMSAYRNMKHEASEENLRIFLLNMKNHEVDIESLLHSLNPKKESDPFNALKLNFDSQITKCLSLCKEEREKRLQEAQTGEDMLRKSAQLFQSQPQEASFVL